MIEQKKLYVITKSNWGGAQKYVFDMAKNDKKSGIEVAVAVGGDGELLERLKKENIETFKIAGLSRDINIFKEFLVFGSLLKIYKKYKPDVVHLNSSKIGGLGSVTARIAKVPKIIFTAHGWVFNESRPFWQIYILKVLSWFTIIFCHEVWVLSQFEERQVKNWPLAHKKILLRPMKLEPINFIEKAPARDFISSKISVAQITQNDFLIGTIAELHKNKGLDLGIDMLIKNPEKIGLENENWKWIIIGQGEEKENLEKQIKENNLQNKIFLIGKVSDAAKYLKSFDLFLFPSRKEGRPYAILEAMQANLKIASTKVGGIPEMLEGYQNKIML